MMNKYITFVVFGVYDLADQLNRNAADGYVLAILEPHELEHPGDTQQYTVVMEHQHPLLAKDVIQEQLGEKKGTTDDANS